MGAAFFEDLIPLYPLYALLFADPSIPGAGLSGAQVSALFALWSLSTVIVEVPSGVIADRFSRRRLVVVGPCITSAGFALWTLVPSFASFAAGFVLWAIGGSLRSGTTQALVYDELVHLGRSEDYARLAGAMRAASAIGVVAGTALAAPLFAWGGYPAAGVASVVSCLMCALASSTLPETDGSGVGDPSTEPVLSEKALSDPAPSDPALTDAGHSEAGLSVLGIVRSGVRDLRTQPAAWGLLLLVVALTWVAALDEYLPLLVESFVSNSPGGADDGVSRTDIPRTVAVLMVVVSLGDVVGALAAGRFRRPAAIGPVVAAAALALMAASLWARPVAVIAVAVAFGAFGWALVVADAALQDRLGSRSRATVTSLAGVGEEVVALLAFAGWAAGSTRFDPPTLFALAAIPYLVVPYLASAGATTVSASRRWRNRMSRNAPM
ncbi:MFS transporter [Gordonia aurantiaca]|uniref:MFS transporter n=1 Tax=Gordonia sp. B21 TaxID=3151852 RepID=UPI0032648C58